MKKILFSLVVVLSSLVAFSATDSELKGMLDANDYKGFAKNSNNHQVKNLITTQDSARLLVSEYASNYSSANVYKSVLLINKSLINYQDAIDIYLSNNNSGAIAVAHYSKDLDILSSTWSRVMSINNPDYELISRYSYDHEMRIRNFDLYKNTCEKLLEMNSKIYSKYLLWGLYNSKFNYPLQFIEYAKSNLDKITKDTYDISGWVYIRYFDMQVVHSKFSWDFKYYSEKSWKNYATSTEWNSEIFKYLIKPVPYANNIYDALSSTVVDPTRAYDLSYYADLANNSNAMKSKLYPIISKDIHLGLKVALELDDADKIIDILIRCKTELSCDELNQIIPIIAALDVSYRKSEIYKALENINGRYTLKLYDDQATWEPITAKVRALMDIRK